jgi:GTP cyclohydrolase II
MKTTRALLPTDQYGTAEIISFADVPGSHEKDHFAVRFRSPDGVSKVPLVRVHSECVTGDVLGSLRCDCGKQLDEALRRLSKEGGLLIYLRQEGRGIGLHEKIKAYALQESGLDTYQANRALGHGEDDRSYEIAAAILKALQLPSIRLLTRNPEKVRALQGHGIDVIQQIQTGLHVNPHNERYLRAKEGRAAHALLAQAPFDLDGKPLAEAP